MSEKRWYEIKAQAKSDTAPGSAEIMVYGNIGESWWEESITAKSFVESLNALDVETITVRINSIGGSVPDGIAIYNSLRRHPATVNVVIDGIAYSIASLVAMAGDTVEMAANALMMLHAPWMNGGGNAIELRAKAEVLDKWSDVMAQTYARKSGDKALFSSLMADGRDHYYTAQEAIDAGLIDQIGEASYVAACATRTEGVSVWHRFTNAVTAAKPQEKTMSEKNNGSAAPAVENSAVDAAGRDAILAADKMRRDTINAFVAPWMNEETRAEVVACADDIHCTVEAAGQRILAAMAKGKAPVAGGHIVTVADERDKFRAGAESAILARAGLVNDDTQNNLRGHTLLELARASLKKAGVSADGMGKMDVVAQAFTHSTSDFPQLLANVARKSMLKGYDESEETFQQWTAVGSLPDFKISRRVDLGDFPTLSMVPEGGEYSYASVGERGETVQLATYGKMFSITRQAIINDDIDAFAKIPRRMGRAAVRTVGNLVYAVLTANPKMSDGKVLFHSDHANVMAAVDPTTASVDEIIRKMRLQKDALGTALGIRLTYLICPVALEGKALLVANNEYEVGAVKDATLQNIVRGRFNVISDPRLDTASPTIWYGAASPQTYDTVEVSYLDGQQSPVLEQQGGWNIDGVEFKVRLDAGVKALDYRTLSRVG